MTVVYCAGLYLRWITGQLFGDSWWLLALADTFALYLYAPLLVLAPIALLTRRRSALLAVFAGATLFFAQYGALLIPIPLRAQSAGINALRVMTFNIPFPYYGSDEQALIDHILAQNADVVFTQELTPRGVDALLRGLRPTYPYIASELSGLPHEGKLVFSKYPLRPDQVIEETTRGRTSQVVIATIDGQEVVLVNMHPTSTYGVAHLDDLPYAVDVTYALRESEVNDVLKYLSGETRPVIIAGDMNTTEQTTAYRMLTQHYSDSWRDVGVGFGLTFPAPVFKLSHIPLPLPNRLKADGGLLDRTIPVGLLRLDYVLHSMDFRTIHAQTAVIGQSDHIAVVSDLVWTDHH